MNENKDINIMVILAEVQDDNGPVLLEEAIESMYIAVKRFYYDKYQLDGIDLSIKSLLCRSRLEMTRKHLPYYLNVEATAHDLVENQGKRSPFIAAMGGYVNNFLDTVLANNQVDDMGLVIAVIDYPLEYIEDYGYEYGFTNQEMDIEFKELRKDDYDIMTVMIHHEDVQKLNNSVRGR